MKKSISKQKSILTSDYTLNYQFKAEKLKTSSYYQHAVLLLLRI